MLVQIEIFKLSSLLKSDNKIERAVEKKIQLLTFVAFFFFSFPLAKSLPRDLQITAYK